MVPFLSDLLIVIDFDEGANHGINRVLAIRNQLTGQQGKCSTRFIA